MSLSQCAVLLPVHLATLCNDEYINGAFSSIGILDCDHVILDFTDVIQLEDAIANNKLTIIKRVRGSIPEGTMQDVTNPVSESSLNIPIGIDNTVAWLDYSVSQANSNFYETMNRKNTFFIGYNSTTNTAHIIEFPITWKALPAQVPDTSRELQFYSITGEWFAKPEQFPDFVTGMPATVFE